MASAGPDPMTLTLKHDRPFDPPTQLRRLREGAPINRLAFPDGHLGWLVTGYSAGRQVLSDPRFSARQELRRFPVPLPFLSEQREPARPGWFLRMDPPDHTRYRRLLAKQFTARRMNQLTSRVKAIAEEHTDAMARQGPPVDLVRAYALPIPSLVICELLGVPYAEREQFQQHSATMFHLDASRDEANVAVTGLRRFLNELVRARLTARTDDLLGDLTASGELTDEELTNVAMLLLVAGNETTANMLALGAFALLCKPDQLAVLHADPSLIDGAVEELLRYLPIIHTGLMRTALEDVIIEGTRVAAGETVVVAVAEANRDPEHVTDPETLNVARPAGSHITFGHGVHQCLGQQLARIEMRIGFAALLERFPGLRLAVPPEEVPLGTDRRVFGVRRLPVSW